MVPPPDEAPPALLVVLVAEPPDFLHENVRDSLNLDTTSVLPLPHTPTR